MNMNIDQFKAELDAKLEEMGTEGLKAYFEQFKTKPLEPLTEILDMLDLPFTATPDGSVVISLSESKERSLKLEFFPSGELVIIKRVGEHREYDEWEMCPALAQALAIPSKSGEELA